MDDIKNIFKYINTLNKRHKLQLYILIFLNIGLAILDSGAIISTSSTFSLNNLSSLKILILIMLLTTLFRAFLYYLISFHLKSVGKTTSNAIFQYIVNYEYEKFITTSKKEIKNTITYRLNAVIHGIHTTTITILHSAISLPFFMVAISTLIGKEVIYIFITLILILIFTYSKYKKFIAHSNKVADQSNGNILELVSNMITDPRSLKIYDLENVFAKNFSSNDSELRNTQATNILFTILPRTLAEVFIYVSAFLVLLISNDNNVSNVFVLGPILLVTLARVIPLLTNLNTNFIIFKANHVALSTILEYKRKIKEKPHLVIKKYAKLESIDLINYKKIIYYYPNKKKATLSINNLTLKKGFPLIITGASGMGKSTLLDVMCGLLSSNSIQIDARLNKTNKVLDKYYLKQNSSYCGQTNFLIPGTVEDNLMIGEVGKIKKDFIYSLLREFGLSEFNLKDVVNDGKDLVSGGQKQRINIIRCLIEKRKILFMDEPSSALDKKNTNILIRLINKYTKNKLVGIVSHDLQAFSQIKNGRIFDLDKLL